MHFLRKDLKTFTAEIIKAVGANVLSNIFVQITFQKINTEQMKEMKNILITGFNNLMNYYALKNG